MTSQCVMDTMSGIDTWPWPTANTAEIRLPGFINPKVTAILVLQGHFNPLETHLIILEFKVMQLSLFFDIYVVPTGSP